VFFVVLLMGMLVGYDVVLVFDVVLFVVGDKCMMYDEVVDVVWCLM